MMPLNKLGCLGAGLACLHHWWQVDRVRVSPSQGRLIAIQLPALLEISGEQWRLESRDQETFNDQTVIRYVCVMGVERGELCVFMPNGDDWRSRVLWVRGEDSLFIEESSVGVYPLPVRYQSVC